MHESTFAGAKMGLAAVLAGSVAPPVGPTAAFGEVETPAGPLAGGTAPAFLGAGLGAAAGALPGANLGACVLQRMTSVGRPSCMREAPSRAFHVLEHLLITLVME